MRILQLIDSLEAGGAERMAVNLANALHAAGVPVVLVASRAAGVLQAQLHSEVPFYCLHKKSTLDIKAFKRLKGIVNTHEINLIHVHSSSFFMATWLKWRLPQLKLVWHDHYGHSDMLANRPKRMLNFCARYFDGIIAVNQQLANWSATILKHGHIKVLPNFVVMTDNMAPTTTLQGQAGKRLLCLANLRPQKDHLTLLKAFKIVNEVFPDWTLHLVGKDFKDAYSRELTNKIQELQLQHQVFTYGSREDISHILAQANIGVLSSESEGLPLALLEYGMAGLPVVATTVGDVPLVLSHRESGLLVPAGNAQALAMALQDLIEQPQLAETYGNQLKQSVQTAFSAQAATLQLIKFYKTLNHAAQL
jgi:glycosyltransferase involved in cell wall biosynthesis